ncbi:MAG: DUF5131 family protein [Cyanobacteria bacterium J06635_1]
MAENSKIQWTDHTFNPWIGCTKVSLGCLHCYAEEMMDKRYHRVQWGDNGTRSRTSPENWKKPLQWNRRAEKEGRRHRVFCASLADVFEDNEQVYNWRLDLWETLIQQTPNLDWLLLTKRVDIAAKFLPYRSRRPSNVWLGASVCNQEEADRIIPQLLDLRRYVAGVFLSCEPLLEKVEFQRSANGRFYDYLINQWFPCGRGAGGAVAGGRISTCDGGVDWVICGGESGGKARECDLTWLYWIVSQCQRARVPVFVKQLGSKPVVLDEPYSATGKGGDPAKWPENLRVRQFPEFGGVK